MVIPPLTPESIGDAERSALSRQSYAPQPVIDGVRITDVLYAPDDGGCFCELGRLTVGIPAAFPGFEIRQVNYGELVPGAVKAWHLHFHQEDIWFVPPSDRLLVCLRDARTLSPTYGVLQRLTLGAGRARLLLIPRGVAHGAANLWLQTSRIIYFVNDTFTAEPDATDEWRLPWNAFGTSCWEVTKG